MRVLICGGAGYIGSHLVRELSAAHPNYQLIVLDNLSKGHVASLPLGVTLVRVDVRDEAALDRAFREHRPDAVMHFCASIAVHESVSDPLAYYDNNVVGTVRLLNAMRNHGVGLFIFSSTAAVFGNPATVPIPDDAPNDPINPYGDTKLAVERLLRWCEHAYGLRYVCLRYFNACGADESGEIGEDHQPETHLIPLVLQVPLGLRDHVRICGDDYDTRDGTCIRDYVHVTDLATAHIRALEYLMRGGESQQFNLGSGTGYSVHEVIEAARKVTGHSIPAVREARRPGDPPVLIAGSERAERVLGWRRRYNTIEDIVASAWKFHQAHPNGYANQIEAQVDLTSIRPPSPANF